MKHYRLDFSPNGADLFPLYCGRQDYSSNTLQDSMSVWRDRER